MCFADKDKLAVHINVLNSEIALIKGRIGPEDCGHLYTAVSVLEERVKELEALNALLAKNQIN